MLSYMIGLLLLSAVFCFIGSAKNVFIGIALGLFIFALGLFRYSQGRELDDEREYIFLQTGFVLLSICVVSLIYGIIHL